jgi:hypothetical protein
MGNSTNPVGNNQPPSIPVVVYFVAVNGSQTGPFNVQQLQNLVANGQLQRNTLVWKQGMTNWEEAFKLLDLQSLFETIPPINP